MSNFKPIYEHLEEIEQSIRQAFLECWDMCEANTRTDLNVNAVLRHLDDVYDINVASRSHYQDTFYKVKSEFENYKF